MFHDNVKIIGHIHAYYMKYSILNMKTNPTAGFDLLLHSIGDHTDISFRQVYTPAVLYSSDCQPGLGAPQGVLLQLPQGTWKERRVA